MSDDVQYKLGDLVNGHVWTGTVWLPVNQVPSGARTQTPPVGAAVNGHRFDGTRWVPLHPGAGPVAAGSKPWYLTPVGIVGVTLSAILGLAVVLPALGAGDSAASSSNAQALGSGTPSVGEDLTPETPATTPTESVVTPADRARVNEWTVKVADIDRDASAEIRDANMFNDDPDYTYVIVTLKGTNGADEIKDLSSFTVKLQGSNKTVYKDESFLMVMPRELATEAAPGGTVKAQFVFDVPQSALGDGAFVLVDDVPVALP